MRREGNLWNALTIHRLYQAGSIEAGPAFRGRARQKAASHPREPAPVRSRTPEKRSSGASDRNIRHQPDKALRLPIAGFLGEKTEGIDQPAAGDHFVVQMIARRATGAADLSNDVAALHL